MPAVISRKPEIKQDLQRAHAFVRCSVFTLHVIYTMFDTKQLNEECLWRIVQILQKQLHVPTSSRNPSTSHCLSYLCNIEQHVVQFVLWCNGQFQNHLSVVHASPLPFLLQDPLELIQQKMPTPVHWSAKILTKCPPKFWMETSIHIQHTFLHQTYFANYYLQLLKCIR